MTVKEICSSFNIDGKYIGCEEVPTGNINSTYKVNFDFNGEKREYILQKINKNVFTEPEKVMDNIIRVTDHVRMNALKRGLVTRRFVLRAFTSKNDEDPFVIDDYGEYWRCYRFIENSITYDTVEDLNIIERAGSAFGRFQSCLDGFAPDTLFITIPDFHNTPKRYQSFKDAIEKDCKKRVKKVKVEIEKLLNFEERAEKLQKLFEQGKIPPRVTHNDTKCNNVSFDKTTGEALAVLDLDTVMPGMIFHDFGDAIRFIANSVIEDCPDIESVELDINKYEAFTKGFIGELKYNLTDIEKETLNLGVFTITVELAVRFLTDYINGDTYFKIKYPGHNLDRARNQIALAESILKKMQVLDEILKKYL